MDLTQYRAPGVYINEAPAPLQSIPTSIPAFVGYTQKADLAGKSITNVPTLITSFADFESYFGGAPDYQFPILKVASPLPGDPALAAGDYDFEIGGNFYKIGQAVQGLFYLYNAIRLFYLNGGQQALIVSVGGYTSGQDSAPAMVDCYTLLNGLALLGNAIGPKPTMVLIPDALALPAFADYSTVQQQMIAQAGTLQDRFAILDIYNGYQGLDTSVISDFRNAVGITHLSYAAAYYPWLETSVVGNAEITLKNVYAPKATDDAQMVALSTIVPDPALPSSQADVATILKAILYKVNILPPGPAMAGIYTQTDNNLGIWNAPANVNIIAAIAPTVRIDDAEQAALNVGAVAGKSINAIRSFHGIGPAIVWGARTLDGNDLDYRYISVRRTMMMLQQNIAQITSQYVLEPNTSQTWVSVNAEISNFLNSIWMEGGLMGASASAAYTVQIGLGSTMTAQDIQDGIMRIGVQVALSSPAEFIAITYEQQMAAS